MVEIKRISLLKRASAWLLDIILIAVLSTGAMWIISIICNYSQAEKTALEYNKQYSDFETEYGKDLANLYGYTYDEETETYISFDGKTSSFNSVIQRLVNAHNDGSELSELENNAYSVYETLPTPAVVTKQYQYVYTLIFMILSLGIFTAYFVLEFIVPLIFGNGQTVGKKIFGICVIRPNGVKINNIILFVRTILGKYTIETMFPVFLIFLFLFGGIGVIGLVLLVALLVWNAILLFTSQNRTPIHDVISGTITADMKLQVIYTKEQDTSDNTTDLVK